jgi:hypothetical protein
MPAITREGTLDYFIDAPENPKNRNLENPKSGVSDRVYLFKVEDYKRMKETGESFNNYQERVKTAYDAVRREATPELDHAEVNCKAKTFNGGKEIFVDNHGRVMPCCYIGTHLNGVHTDAQSLQLHYEMNQYGWDHFNLKNYSLKEILDADHLNKVFADTWNKPSCQQGKLAYCANICGTYSRIDKIYTHDDMEDKTRNWRQN